VTSNLVPGNVPLAGGDRGSRGGGTEDPGGEGKKTQQGGGHMPVLTNNVVRTDLERKHVSDGGGERAIEIERSSTDPRLQAR